VVVPEIHGEQQLLFLMRSVVLSNNFQDGFRGQGDYDLRNNVGGSAIQTQEKWLL